MKLYALILLSLIVISSCTIERRIHQPGWNVQWKKNYSVSQNQDEADPSMHFEKSQESVIFETPSITAENLIGNETIDHQQEPMTESALDQELKSSVSTDELGRDNTHQEVVSSARYNHQEDQVKRSTTKTKFGNHVQHALVLFALGLICALIALLVYFAISTATDAIVLILMVLVFLGAAGLAILLPLMGLMILLGVTLGRNKLS